MARIEKIVSIFHRPLLCEVSVLHYLVCWFACPDWSEMFRYALIGRMEGRTEVPGHPNVWHRGGNTGYEGKRANFCLLKFLKYYIRVAKVIESLSHVDFCVLGIMDPIYAGFR